MAQYCGSAQHEAIRCSVIKLWQKEQKMVHGGGRAAKNYYGEDIMQIRDLYKYGQRFTVKRGEIISDSIEGSDNEYMYILDKGLAALTSTNKRGDEFIYIFFKAPRCIGFSPLVRKMMDIQPFPEVHQPTLLSILAKSDCVLYRISQNDFSEFMKDREFSDLMTQVIFSTYMDMLYHYYTSREASAAGRLCGLIVEQSEADKSGRLILDPLFTYDELSHYLGVHNITVARIMSALKKEGIIKKDGRKTVISDMEKLRAVMNEDIILQY